MFFFFNDTATTEIYTLSLHDALPISPAQASHDGSPLLGRAGQGLDRVAAVPRHRRSEEHTSELQSQSNLVCRLLLEKKKQTGALRREIKWPLPRCHFHGLLYSHQQAL